LPCPLLKTSHTKDPDCPARDDKERGCFLVFPHVDNTPIRPDTITRVFRNKAKEVGLNELTFHGLRHTHAVLMLAANVHPKIVSERLGHSAASITLDLHSHVVPNLQQAAARRFEEVIRLGLVESEPITIR
jgi:integrase